MRLKHASTQTCPFQIQHINFIFRYRLLNGKSPSKHLCAHRYRYKQVILISDTLKVAQQFHCMLDVWQVRRYLIVAKTTLTSSVRPLEKTLSLKATCLTILISVFWCGVYRILFLPPNQKKNQRKVRHQ